MSDQPPIGDPLFDDAPGSAENRPDPNSAATEDERQRIEELKSIWSKLQDETKHRGRAEQFLPYLLVRSVVGDRGDRPINVPFWESPDIWTAPGDPVAAPEIPATPGGTVRANEPNTVYAHVWNLGRAPIAGVKVEWYWFNPSLGINGGDANLIGETRVDLGPRSSPACHRLVKCPATWVPLLENAGHECLVVRVSSIGDLISSSHPWDAWADRHVAQRNITVLPAGAMVSRLMLSLEASRVLATRVQLLQVGAQAAQAVQLVAPHLTVDPAVQTHVLAELRPDSSIHVPITVPVAAPAAAAPIHTMAPIAQPNAISPFAVARVQPSTLLRYEPAQPLPPAADVPSLAEAAPVSVLSRGGTVPILTRHTDLLSPEILRRITTIAPPTPEQAQVLRVASYQGDQLVGGYTLVIAGAQ